MVTVSVQTVLLPQRSVTSQVRVMTWGQVPLEIVLTMLRTRAAVGVQLSA